MIVLFCYSKAIRNKKYLPKAFSIVKVAENLGAMFMTFFAGYIRIRTNGFVGVHALLALSALIATMVAYHY